MSFPDNCLKGIPNGDFLVDEKTAATHLFFFEGRDKGEDGWIESSVNWEDDNRAIDFTLHQSKPGSDEPQFRAGVAVLPRHHIDSTNRLPTVGGVLSYERAALATNSYHGNLLLRSEVKRLKMKQIAAHLALCAVVVPPH
jgi:hypothetical protein